MILEEPALSGERMPRSTPQVGSLSAASISEHCPQKLATRQPATRSRGWIVVKTHQTEGKSGSKGRLESRPREP